jgi:pilus assembly protein CpaF
VVKKLQSNQPFQYNGASRSSGEKRIKETKPAPAKPFSKGKELENIAAETLRQIIDAVDDTLVLEKINAFQKQQFLSQANRTLEMVIEEYGCTLSQSEKQKVVKYVADEVFGYGPINPLIHDPTVSEIMVNGCRQVYVERDGRIEKTDINFRDDAHVLNTIDKILAPLGKKIDHNSPMVDARLPDGSRVNAIIPPLAVKGPTLTIRKFAADPFTSDDLITFGTMSREMARFLKSCVRARVNILVSGGTGSGKTTTLNVLSSFVPDRERIVTIEDAAELQLRQEHVVTLESRPPNIEGKGYISIRDLVINSLRMRPDRIIVGEVRGGEALDMLQAMNTGHDGSISTLHANNPRDTLARLETMVLMAGMDLPLRAIREQISSAVDLIVHQSRMMDGSRKIVNITEVVGMEGDTITMQDIFIYDQTGFNEKGYVTGNHRATGIIPKCIEKLNACGERVPMDVFEGKNIHAPFRRY